MRRALREQNTMGFLKTILYYGGLNNIIIATKFFTSIHNTVSMFYHIDLFYTCDFINWISKGKHSSLKEYTKLLLSIKYNSINKN